MLVFIQFFGGGRGKGKGERGWGGVGVYSRLGANSRLSAYSNKYGVSSSGFLVVAEVEDSGKKLFHHDLSFIKYL